MIEDFAVRDAVRNRLTGFCFAIERAAHFRGLIESLKAGTALPAGSLEARQDGYTISIPADIALPIVQSCLDEVEAEIAAFRSAAAPLVALEAP